MKKLNTKQKPSSKSERIDASSIPGWLNADDMIIISSILEFQSSDGVYGDILEMGVYLGKSAIFLGGFLQADERMIACDLFETVVNESSVSPEVKAFYKDISAEQFLKNYAGFHEVSPKIIKGLSSMVTKSVEEDSCRIVHIDASHSYVDVKQDAISANRLLVGEGVVIFDDYRMEHTIGTAAAVWEMVASFGLKPFAASAMKLYATWGDAEKYTNQVEHVISGCEDYHTDVHELGNSIKVARVAKTIHLED